MKQVAHRYTHEMAYTIADIDRLLPAAVAHAAYTRTEDAGAIIFSAAVNDGAWRITATPRPDRRIALISIPVTHVDIGLQGYDDAAAAAFYQRFMLYFQRGGG
jgi:ribosomal protein L22